MEKVKQFILDQDNTKQASWARWLFRIVLYVCSITIIGINSLPVHRIDLVQQDIKDLTTLLSFMIIAIHSLSKTIGIKIEPEEYK